MADRRIERLADVLVNYSVAIQPGDKVLIQGDAPAAALILAVYEQALRAGGHPLVMPILPGMDEILYRVASEAQLQHVSEPMKLIAETYDAHIRIAADLNTKELSGVDPQKMVVERRAQAAQSAETLGRPPTFPWAGGTRPATDDVAEQLLDRTWRPALEVIGADGLPALADAGNVARPTTTLGLSIRIPPGVDPDAITARLTELLTADPPSGATVTVSPGWGATGWDAPPTASWLAAALHASSTAWFDEEPRSIGEGGTIPFMAMLGEQFPNAQFVVTGVLGPGSNAHGPNEFLHVATGEHLTCCVAEVIASLPA